MASETQRKYQRRSAEGWRALLAQQAVSGLTIGAFCRKVSEHAEGAKNPRGARMILFCLGKSLCNF